MKFLVYIAAVCAVAAAAEQKKEKRGILGLGYGHGAIAEPLSYGPSLAYADHGLALSASYAAPLLKAYSAPAISYSAPSISYAPAISYGSYGSHGYSSPLLTKSFAAPIYTKTIAAPISYSAPLITKSYGAPLIKSYAAPAYALPYSLGHDLDLSLGYGKYLH